MIRASLNPNDATRPPPLPKTDTSDRVRAALLRDVRRAYEAGISGCSARVQVLNGISLAVRPGEVLGLTGSSGSGKSTLLLLLAGVLAPDSGLVSWMAEDGSTIREPSGVEYMPAWRAAHALQSLTRAVAAPPGFLLIDDVFAELDSVSRREVRVLLREIRAARVTMVIATRQAAELRGLCTRVCRLERGALVPQERIR